MKLYHGSRLNKKPEIKVGPYALGVMDNVFDGIFASESKNVSDSHGDFIFEYEIDENKIATTEDINNEMALAVLSKETNIDDKDRLLELLDAVCYEYDLSSFEKEELNCRSDYDADGSWELQRLRGRIAYALGFNAVECVDEHGTSYLIVKE